jgi:hypothetical protein
MLVGVLARLCSHLREMTGLTVRATVSHWTVCSVHILRSRWLALEISLSLRRPVRRASAIRNTFFDIRRRRVNAPLEPQPLHNRPPSPAGFRPFAIVLHRV